MTRVSFPAALKYLKNFITHFTPGPALRSDWIYLSFIIRVLPWGLSVMEKSSSSSKRISLVACVYSCPCPVFCVRFFILLARKRFMFSLVYICSGRVLCCRMNNDDVFYGELRSTTWDTSCKSETPYCGPHGNAYMIIVLRIPLLWKWMSGSSSLPQFSLDVIKHTGFSVSFRYCRVSLLRIKSRSV